MTIPIEIIRSIPYFSGLESDVLEVIRRAMFEKKATRGETVVFEDEPARALFFVASGVVKVFKTSPEGKEQILAIVRPGESFNDVPVFDEGTNPASAQAMGQATLYGIAREEMQGILRQHPQVAMNVIRTLAQKLRQLVSLVEDLSFRHVIGRVARILLEYAGDSVAPRTRLTQQEIAALAGTAREVVGRSLKSLEEDNLIRMERHRIVIRNESALRELAAIAS